MGGTAAGTAISAATSAGLGAIGLTAPATTAGTSSLFKTAATTGTSSLLKTAATTASGVFIAVPGTLPSLIPMFNPASLTGYEKNLDHTKVNEILNRMHEGEIPYSEDYLIDRAQSAYAKGVRSEYYSVDEINAAYALLQNAKYYRQ